MLGEAIYTTRTTLGLSGRAMAELLGVSRSYLSRVERGKKNPTLELINKIDALAHEYGVDVNLGPVMGIEDETVRHLGRFFLNSKVSDVKKASVRRLVHVLMRME